MAQSGQDSPMWAQYKRLKSQYPDIVLLFRLGDFYETFEDDAKLAAQLLDLTLTSKVIRSNKATGEETRVPMAGMPHHAIESYLSRLVGAGYRVAIAEEMEDAREKAQQESQRRREAIERGEYRSKEKAAEKLVRREVVRVVTPGTLTEPTLLQAERNSYIVAVIVEKGRAGLAYADISTGEFCLCELSGADLRQQVEGELTRLQAAELLVPDEEALRLEGMEPARRKLEHDLEFMLKAERDRQLPHERLARKTDRALDTTWVQGHITAWPAWRWDQRTARDALQQQLRVQSLQGYGCEAKPLAIRAAGALIQYLHETQRNAVQQIGGLRTYDVSTYMFLDPQTRRNLELLEGAKGGQKGSLVAVLDQTTTPMGARLLRRWVAQPLLDLDQLRQRQDAVGRFVEDGLLRAELREQLKPLGDLERTVNRIVQGSNANPRDLVRLRQGLRALPALDASLRMAGFEFADVATPAAQTAGSASKGAASYDDYDDDDLFGEPAPRAAVREEPVAAVPELHLASSGELFDLCDDILQLLEQAIADDPPAMLDTWSNSSEENIIRRGFSAKLDEVILASKDARDYMNGLESQEQERTGIKSLKVGFNSVFGYYIEISKAIADRKIPEDYERRQTLVNAERYITPEMKKYEGYILRSQELINDLERQIFRSICKDITAHSTRLLATAARLAELDVDAALAEVAVRNRYVRPRLTSEDCIRIRDGRHPVVEQAIDEAFVGNDVELSTSNEQILVITGPNMSGKSTFLRQIAIIVLMAQIGSYVPAEQAEIGMVDRIFTRIGAQDDIATGQSTFMVEMTETANILHNATPRSLVILDEIGRGTSTYDGLSIARAVVEYIHNQPRLRAKTLFATHYHELTELASVLPRVRNYNVAVAEEGDHVVFLRKIVPGGADRSYGIHVAQMAGMPPAVVRRAEEVLAELEGRGSKEQRRDAMRRANESAQPAAVQQMGLFAPEPSPALEKLRAMDVSQLTPIEALTKLYELQRLAGED